ncbi:MAG: hypothetical protein JRF63_05660 [Deltaproteobacteria bacterium]|nr:hypothetical protein [Deltaproteobacteria bacterium]
MTSKRTIFVRALLGLVVIAPGLALGAVHAPVLAVFLALGAVIFGYLTLRPQGLSRTRFDLPSILLIGLALFTAFQLLPLPSGIVELISPNAYEIRARAMEPLGLQAPSWMPLTLDATLTVVELGKLWLYLAVYWLAVSWTRRHGSSQILTMVVLAGLASAAVLLAHKILMLDQVYDFYTPLHKRMYSSGNISAPLINPNHMGALLGLSAAAAIGQALAASARSRRILMIGVAALIGGSLLLTLSRGAIAAFVAGQLLFVLVRTVSRATGREGGEPKRNLAWLPLGLALSLALGLFAAQDAIIGEYLEGDFHKLELFREGLPLVGDFPAVGVGRGAFWVAFPMVSEWAARVTFTHAENSVLQLLSDWGVLFGGIALLGFGLIIARRLIQPPARLRPTAALVGLVAFGLHNLLDFNMEIPGVAVLAVVLLGTLVGSEEAGRGRSPTRKRRGLVVPRAVLAVAAAITLALAAVTGLYAARYSIDGEERALREALARDDSPAFSDENMEQRLKRHPASWYLPFLAGVHTFHVGAGNCLPWLSRALEVNPSAASAHLYAGRALLRVGKLDQAMLELRLASRGNPKLAPPAARFLVGALPRFDRLSKMAVDREDKLLLWGALARELAVRGLDEEAEAADLAVLTVDPNEPRSLARQARRMIKREQLDDALELAERLDEQPDFRPAAAILEAEVHRKRQDAEAELSALVKGLHRSPRHPGLLRELAWAAQRAGDHDRAMRTAAELRATATDESKRSRAAVLEGDLERNEGRIDAALARYRQAYAMNPSNPSLLKRIANLAQSHGDDLRALEALRKLVNIDPANQEWRRRLDELEKKGRTKPIEIP